MRVKKTLTVIGGVLLTIGILYFTIRNIGSLNPFLLFHIGINWSLAGLSALIFAFSNLVRAFAYPLGIDRRLSLIEAFRIVAVGNAANMILPLRLGEGVRLSLFPHSYGPVKRTRLTLIPGVADIAVILLLCLLAIRLASTRHTFLLRALGMTASVFGGIILVALLLTAAIPFLRRKAAAYFRADLLIMSFWVALSWGVMLLSIWVGLLAYGYGAAPSIRYSLVVFAATNLIMFIPSTPGGIGVFEYGVILGLGGFGIPEAAGKTVGLLLHLIQYTAMLPMGLALYLTGARRRFSAGMKRGRFEKSRPY